ncbi:hypothetical protein [Pyrobaculum aerophilum]|nr:hypothetical protein [Pyrobaculum aerophilum]HII47460.1 hypothetical protein [Pyrobaculum aerophilum]
MYFGKFDLESAMGVLAIMTLISFGITPLYTIANDNFTRRIEFFRATGVGFSTYFILLIASATALTILTATVPMLILYFVIYGSEVLKALSPGYFIGLASSSLIFCAIGVVLGLWKPSFSFAGGLGTGIIIMLSLGPVMASYFAGVTAPLYVPPVAPLFIDDVWLKLLVLLAVFLPLYVAARILYITFFHTAKPIA